MLPRFFLFPEEVNPCDVMGMIIYSHPVQLPCLFPDIPDVLQVMPGDHLTVPAKDMPLRGSYGEEKAEAPNGSCLLRS